MRDDVKPFLAALDPPAGWGWPCAHHHPDGHLSYMEWHEKAHRLLWEGVEQERCPVCHYYYFPDEMGVPADALTEGRADA